MIHDPLGQYSHLIKRRLGYFRGPLPISIDGDDLEQSAVVGLLEAAKAYEGRNGAKFETYAGNRIFGAIIDQIRNAKTGTRHGKSIEQNNQDQIDHIASNDKSPHECVHGRKVLECLSKARELLSERERIVIDLYYEHEFNMDEIAQVFGLTQGRISQIHKRGIEILREGMADWVS